MLTYKPWKQLPTLAGCAVDLKKNNSESVTTEVKENSPIDALTLLNEDIHNIGQITVQNHFTLDCLLASQGAVCA